MKLVSLFVHKLYGRFDYVVQFNNDETFLYEMNGCGLTTILNITEAITTGQLYKLFCYEFDTIDLKYEKWFREERKRNCYNFKKEYVEIISDAVCRSYALRVSMPLK